MNYSDSELKTRIDELVTNYVKTFIEKEALQEIDIIKSYLKDNNSNNLFSDEDIDHFSKFLSSCADETSDKNEEWMSRFHSLTKNQQYNLAKESQNAYLSKTSKNLVREKLIEDPLFSAKIVHMDYIVSDVNSWTYKLPYVDGMFLYEECPICLEMFEESFFVCQLFCRHTYHLNCLEQWLYERPVCPLCQKEIKTRLKINYEYEKEMMEDGRLKVTINLVTSAESD